MLAVVRGETNACVGTAGLDRGEGRGAVPRSQVDNGANVEAVDELFPEVWRHRVEEHRLHSRISAASRRVIVVVVVLVGAANAAADRDDAAVRQDGLFGAPVETPLLFTQWHRHAVDDVQRGVAFEVHPWSRRAEGSWEVGSHHLDGLQATLLAQPLTRAHRFKMRSAS